MNKKLVYSFYLNKDGMSNDINKFHMKCLQHYACVFDEMSFTIIRDKNLPTEELLQMKRFLVSLSPTVPISIKVIENSRLRESVVFKNDIVDRFGKDELVWFGHNKGISNESVCSKDIIFTWIAALYFYTLNYMDEVEEYLNDCRFLSYGALHTHSEISKEYIKYCWFYSGTFMWINSKSIYQYIRNNNIELPAFGDRFYDEGFLGNCFTSWPSGHAASHGMRYIKIIDDRWYDDFYSYLDLMYPDHSDLDEFINQRKIEINEQ